MKAAYKAFEAENMKKIKAENPTMRMSQWKQMLHKEWTKSPENPINAQKANQSLYKVTIIFSLLVIYF